MSGREAAAPGGGPQSGRGKKSDLLALRVASKDCHDAVRRAVKTHASCENISLAPGLHGTYDRPECVAAVGRVFGAGCREVYFQGDTEALENAFEEFVKTTEGRLRILRVGDRLHLGRRALPQSTKFGRSHESVRQRPPRRHLRGRGSPGGTRRRHGAHDRTPGGPAEILSSLSICMYTATLAPVGHGILLAGATPPRGHREFELYIVTPLN